MIEEIKSAKPAPKKGRSSKAAKAIRQGLKLKRGPKPGAVVKFTRTITFAPNVTKHFEYAAIFAGGHWYFTGTGQLGQARLTHDAFLTTMSDESISKIRMMKVSEKI